MSRLSTFIRMRSSFFLSRHIPSLDVFLLLAGKSRRIKRLEFATWEKIRVDWALSLSGVLGSVLDRAH
jgi:hypothetical protein